MEAGVALVFVSTGGPMVVPARVKVLHTDLSRPLDPKWLRRRSVSNPFSKTLKMQVETLKTGKWLARSSSCTLSKREVYKTIKASTFSLLHDMDALYWHFVMDAL